MPRKMQAPPLPFDNEFITFDVMGNGEKAVLQVLSLNGLGLLTRKFPTAL